MSLRPDSASPSPAGARRDAGSSPAEIPSPCGISACAPANPFPAQVGLTKEEVADRVARGEVNVDAGVKTRSVAQIVRENVVTLFNLVNIALFALVAYTGSFKNGLFMIVIVLNTAIGIVQEVRSKRVTDRLSIVVGSDAKLVRDGRRVDVPQDQVVRGDLVVLGRGDQVPCDSTVVDGTARVDESLLTGESDLIAKCAGDSLMSGSFVSSGLVAARVDHVGSENYAAKISAEAKRRKAPNSEIMRSLNGIIRFVSIALVPVGAALYLTTRHGGVEQVPAILSTVAALVGMVPEGLILLTSTVLALAVIRLSKRNVLVQQLYCIETLARVDTLCLDKTGTITSGRMEMTGLHPLVAAGRPDGPGATRYALADAPTGGAGEEDARHEGSDRTGIAAVLRAVACADPDPNATAEAIAAWGGGGAAGGTDEADEAGAAGASGATGTAGASGASDKTSPRAVGHVPFSSERKWSGAELDDGTCWVLGAAQFVMGDDFHQVKDAVEGLSDQSRVLLLAQVDGFDGEAFLGRPRPAALVCIRDQIRASAQRAIAFFREQGVDVKVISGDDPRTVAGIAAQVGVADAERYVDATTLITEEDIARAVGDYHVFGRVRPEQKRSFVRALQTQGHVVAMTGDGVNDTLALKESDCSVAMAAGSDAARNVAQLVLVDNDFASMPHVVAEGRRSINNLQRSASLFLVKTVFSMVLALLFVFIPWQYPFQPIQMTLVSAFMIGIPSFVLALEPNRDRIKGRFLENVLVRSLPGSATVIVAVAVLCCVGYLGLHMGYEQVSTMCVVVTAWTGFNLIFRISVPFTPIRAALLVVVASAFTGCLALFPWLFSIAPFTAPMLACVAAACAGATALFHVLFNALGSWHRVRQDRLT